MLNARHIRIEVLMNRILRGIAVVACCVLLFGCSSQEEDSALEAQPAAEKPKSANKPFAMEQQLIRDAKSIQGILDEDAEKKKKALDNIN